MSTVLDTAATDSVASAAPKPSPHAEPAMPTSAPSPTKVRNTAPRVAPSARTVPISGRRCTTEIATVL